MGRTSLLCLDLNFPETDRHAIIQKEVIQFLNRPSSKYTRNAFMETERGAAAAELRR
jgi:hypothetical protein